VVEESQSRGQMRGRAGAEVVQAKGGPQEKKAKLTQSFFCGLHNSQVIIMHGGEGPLAHQHGPPLPFLSFLPRSSLQPAGPSSSDQGGRSSSPGLDCPSLPPSPFPSLVLQMCLSLFWSFPNRGFIFFRAFFRWGVITERYSRVKEGRGGPEEGQSRGRGGVQ
jgi:hypothetical protein